ncbi:hypothetical protein DPMN_149224 [Dreissena polymorpha]|uniref:Uncharacterized protein n=1 Tax=Dreissena polymorpha TaxID=45954 RepID=A0A9D4FBB5_DREPO|nr:hypothetical protein DPMN_149224 [Dreissena polymorpha]
MEHKTNENVLPERDSNTCWRTRASPQPLPTKAGLVQTSNKARVSVQDCVAWHAIRDRRGGHLKKPSHE